MAQDPADADKIMHAQLETDSGFSLMGSDAASGTPSQPMSGVQVSLSGDAGTDAELSGYYDRLAQGGTVVEPLEQAPWGDKFGMVTDPYGVLWMVNIPDPRAGSRQRRGGRWPPRDRDRGRSRSLAVLTNVELPGAGTGDVRMVDHARRMASGRPASTRPGPWPATENDAVVTAYDPPRLAAMKGSASAPFEATLAFEPVDGGTRVEVETIFHLSGAMRLIGPLFIRSYERGWDRGLVNVKRMMESGELQAPATIAAMSETSVSPTPAPDRLPGGRTEPLDPAEAERLFRRGDRGLQRGPLLARSRGVGDAVARRARRGARLLPGPDPGRGGPAPPPAPQPPRRAQQAVGGPREAAAVSACAPGRLRQRARSVRRRRILDDLDGGLLPYLIPPILRFTDAEAPDFSR